MIADADYSRQVNPGFEVRERSAAEDGAFVNSLRVEPELGTPIRGGLPATIARRTANGWALSGRKIYATGSPVLAWNAIWMMRPSTAAAS